MDQEYSNLKNKKTKEIPFTYYYDGRKKNWKEEHFAAKPDEPTKTAVKTWIETWKNTPVYEEPEQVLDMLFHKQCPGNVELKDVLIKVCVLNDFYSTNIYHVYEVSKAICKLHIDDAIEGKDLDIVDKIAVKIKETTGRSGYSFASKYVSHHKPEYYPIYDSYVDILLRYYRDKYQKIHFENAELKTYKQFYDVEERFKRDFQLDQDIFSAKDIDKFLWQVGKKCFPLWKKYHPAFNEE